MSIIRDAFEKANKENRAAIIAYYTVGFPNLETSIEALTSFAQIADIVELGIPFSDPLADGETIQKSSQVALSHGINTELAFSVAKKIREKTQTPLIVMTYYNLFYRLGLEKFADEASAAGINGVIIPDLPPEEADDWLNVSKSKTETIFLLAPTSTEDRIKQVGKLTQEFIYCVSVTGVTGQREKLPNYLPAFIDKVKSLTGKRVALGFGISSASQVAELAKMVDGVIVGSALIKLVDEASTFEQGLAKSLELIKSFKQKGKR